jgi:hypothetical protein
VAPVLAGLLSREIAVEAGEERARDVRFAILALAELGLRQVVAAVEDTPRFQICRQLGGRDQGVKCPNLQPQAAMQPLVEVHLGVFHR